VLNIVCGAPNVEAGQTVPVAVVGTKSMIKPETFLKLKKQRSEVKFLRE
jgi:phenylalanyl-tRNA synthetase beta chain